MFKLRNFKQERLDREDKEREKQAQIQKEEREAQKERRKDAERRYSQKLAHLAKETEGQEICFNCEFVDKYTDEFSSYLEEKYHCRRLPPTIPVEADVRRNKDRGAWPEVEYAESCGEFLTSKENHA